VNEHKAKLLTFFDASYDAQHNWPKFDFDSANKCVALAEEIVQSKSSLPTEHLVQLEFETRLVLERLNEPYQDKLKNKFFFWIKKKLLLPKLEGLIKLVQDKISISPHSHMKLLVQVCSGRYKCKETLTALYTRQKIKGENLQTALEALFDEGFSVFERAMSSDSGSLGAYVDRLKEVFLIYYDTALTKDDFLAIQFQSQSILKSESTEFGGMKNRPGFMNLKNWNAILEKLTWNFVKNIKLY
jgi:hypothetical protein